MAEKYQILSGASAPESLDLEPIKARIATRRVGRTPERGTDIDALLAEVERLRDKLADMVSRDWHGLMAILDYAYPESIFPITEDAMARDPGPRIVSLIRHLDKARKQIAAVRALADHPPSPKILPREILAALDGADA